MREASERKENDCLIISQWWSEDGFMTEADYFAFLKITYKRLTQKYTNIYFKAHPRESAEFVNRLTKEFDFKFLPTEYSDLPIELYLLNNNLDLYGFWTSAMFYAKKAFNMNVYSLFDSLVENYPENKMIYELHESVKPLLQQYGIPQLAVT